MKGVLNSAFTDSYWPSDRLPGSELLQWCNCVTAGCSLTSFSTSSSPPASFCLSVLPGHKRSDAHRQKHKGLPLEDCLYVTWCMCFFVVVFLLWLTSLTFIFDLAEDSRKAQLLHWRARFWPCSFPTTLSSSKSHLFPTKIIGTYTTEKEKHLMSVYTMFLSGLI